MEAMDRERLELYELLKPKLDEECARRLILALPHRADELVTIDHLDMKLNALGSGLTDKLTWRMITIMGAWTAIGTSLFALLSKLVR